MRDTPKTNLLTQMVGRHFLKRVIRPRRATNDQEDVERRIATPIIEALVVLTLIR